MKGLKCTAAEGLSILSPRLQGALKGTSTTLRFRVEEKRICSAEEMSTHHHPSLFA